MAETLVKVGMQIIAHITVSVNSGSRRLINHKLVIESIAMGRLVVGFRQVSNGHTLRTVTGTDPVGIGQVDAYGRRGILVASEHGGTDNVGCNALDLRLSETRIDGRMVLKPLCMRRDGFRAASGYHVFIFH